ncbi:MAG: DUF4235 domain-containing protein [Buchananella hordeovulneris]|nr:DUF4235 domain-containing protein [Buchananella hordeovulneris]
MDLGWKVTHLAAAAAAGFAANFVLKKAWQLTTGRDAPVDDEDPDVSVAEVLVYAAVSGVVFTLLRRGAVGAAAHLYGPKGYDPRRKVQLEQA